MTVETKTDRSPITSAERTNSGRHEEGGGWVTRPEPSPETTEELEFAVEGPPVSWPRVFPGL